MKPWNSDTVFLNSATAERLYGNIKDAPIYDYHCHLSPKEIYEDKVFSNIGELWLGGDHYKWRLMRSAGIDEAYITGGASWHDKFVAYAKALQFAAGNPLYHWSHFELKQFFGITKPLCEATAEEIWQEANRVLQTKALSPRKLIQQSGVAYIATTDDIADSLEYHKKLAGSFDVRVAPSFRTDNLLLMRQPGYSGYIAKLGDIKTLADLKAAVVRHLDRFVAAGCKFTDVGIEWFPQTIADEAAADRAFQKALAAQPVSDEEYDGFIGHLYVFLAKEYKRRNLVMQLHLGVKRNANTALFRAVGPDCGGDCVGEAITAGALTALLDAMNENGGLPRTILYTLNPQAYYVLATAALSYRGVTLGAAWWFCDHASGIKEQLQIYAETACLGTFTGMLTDSRSFLSYARHDYFRRILCDTVGGWIEDGTYADGPQAEAMLRRIAYENIQNLIE